MVTTDQKEVLLGNISLYIERYRVRSLLDIGAGDASLAPQISQKVDHYLAVECNTSNVTKLKESALPVMQAEFPVPIEDTFDLVLVSHAIPESKEKYEAFLSAAWQLVRPGGVLLIATFKGGVNGIRALANRWHNTDRAFDADLYQTMMKRLNQFGEVSVRRVESSFLSPDINEITALALEAIQPKEKDREMCAVFVRNHVENTKDQNGQYRLPAEHLFISVAK